MSRSVGDVLDRLFSAKGLPRTIEVVRPYSEVSALKVGQVWRWSEPDRAYVCAAAPAMFILAFEVRRHLGWVYEPALDLGEVAA
jgi:hypothetical protein